MSEKDFRPKRRKPDPAPKLAEPRLPEFKLERERQSELLSFEQAVTHVTERVLEILQTKPLVTALLYGMPNAGKSAFVDAVMQNLRQRSGDNMIYGGEIKGFDEKPRYFGKDLPAVYFIDQITHAVGYEIEEKVVASNVKASGFPEPDFTIVIVNPNQSRVAATTFMGRADVIIDNPSSRVKKY